MSLQLTILTIDINEMTSSPMVEVFDQDVVHIGRKATVNDVVLSRSEISGKHLQIRVDKSQGKERIFVMDLGSLNGTTIEGIPLEPNVERELRQGQRIGVGSYIIRPLIVEGSKSVEKQKEGDSYTSKKRESTISGDSGSDNSIDSSAKYFEMIGDFSFDSEQNSRGDVPVSSLVGESPDNSSHYAVSGDSNPGSSLYEETGYEKTELKSSYYDDYEDKDENENKEENEDEYDDIEEEGISEELVNPMEQGEEDVNNFEDEEDEQVYEDDNNDDEEDERDEEIEDVEDEEYEEEEENVEDEDEVEDEEVENVEEDEEEEDVEEEDIQEDDEDVEEDEEDDDDEVEEVSELLSSHLEYDDSAMKDENSTCDLINYDFEGIELFSISGRVIHNGKPFAGVKIDVGELGSVVTDDQGEFVLNNIEEGSEYSVSPSMNRYVFKCESDVTKGILYDDVNLVFQAKEMCAIEGEVKSRKGKPLANVEIDGGNLGTTFTDRDGHFVFDNIIEGTSYNLTLKKDKYKFTPVNYSGVVTRNISLQMIGNKLLRIDGYVRHKGVPIEGVRVDAGAVGVTVTDHNGYYCFENIPEGTEYEISLYKEGFKFGKSKK